MPNRTHGILWQGPSPLDGAPIVAIATDNTGNPKTGPMVQTWILRADMPPIEAVRNGADRSICGTCPLRAPHGGFAERGCYVQVPQEPADIELTLCSAVAAALPGDYRLLGVLKAWLETHQAHVNVPRLKRFLHTDNRPISRALWAAIGGWLAREDTRWQTLAALHRGEPLDLDDPEVTQIQMQRVGPDPRFANTALRVHAKLLRSRSEDVDDPIELAKRHPVYLKRVQLGANYRADVWAALDRSPDATPAAIARQAGCAYETARLVAGDWRIARAAQSPASAS